MIALLTFVVQFIQILTGLLWWCIFIWVLMSWFAASKSRLGELLESIVRPILAPFRWARIGMLDLSPIVALLFIRFISDYLVQGILQYMQTL